MSSSADIEEGLTFTPKFDADGLLTAVVTDAKSGEVLMVAHMNAEAVRLTIETGEAWYYSRSRQKLWKKGESSGHVQRVSSCASIATRTRSGSRSSSSGRAPATPDGARASTAPPRSGRRAR